MKMFKQYPVAKYWFEKKDEDFLFKNIFVRVKVLSYIRDNPSILMNYVLNGNESAAVMAYKLYGDSKLYWTILLVNDIVDPKDWVMSPAHLEEFLTTKYLSRDEIVMTVRNGQQADMQTNQYMITKKPFGTVDSDPDASLTDPLTYDKISAKELEEMKNDDRRVVKAIRKEYMSAFISDFERRIKSI